MEKYFFSSHSNLNFILTNSINMKKKGTYKVSLGELYNKWDSPFYRVKNLETQKYNRRSNLFDKCLVENVFEGLVDNLFKITCDDCSIVCTLDTFLLTPTCFCSVNDIIKDKTCVAINTDKGITWQRVKQVEFMGKASTYSVNVQNEDSNVYIVDNFVVKTKRVDIFDVNK